MSRRFSIVDLVRRRRLKRRALKAAGSPLFDSPWYQQWYPDGRDAELATALCLFPYRKPSIAFIMI